MSDLYPDPNDKRPLIVRDPVKAISKMHMIDRAIAALERLGGVDEASRIRYRKEIMDLMGVDGDPAAHCSPVIVDHKVAVAEAKKPAKRKAKKENV